jgi:hypothetical protein
MPNKSYGQGERLVGKVVGGPNKQSHAKFNNGFKLLWSPPSNYKHLWGIG